MEKTKTLQDISHGGPAAGWIALGVLVLCTILLLTGRAGWLIAGYNTATKEEKVRYDEKKLCRVAGCGFLVIDLFILVMLIGEAVLPYWCAYITGGVIGVDVLVMIILMNTICKTK